MDTVTLIRSAVRRLLAAAATTADKAAGAAAADGAEGLEGELRGLLSRDDDYRSAGKPSCDWDDRATREALVYALARDARALVPGLTGTSSSGR
jgi:hypothetical protein